MKIRSAVIGGTGAGAILDQMSARPLHVPTEFGTVRTRLLESEGSLVVAVSRHGFGHRLPPHRVNYRGIAAALQRLGVVHCLATAAVGSLRTDWGAGTLALCHDFLDVSARNLTIHDRNVEHVDFTHPFGPRTRDAVIEAAGAQGVQIESHCVYVSGPGPRYETPHEIQMFKHLGDVVGMTAGSEAVAMRESGIDYSCVAIVTNLAAGISSTSLSHHEVVEEMGRSGPKALQLIFGAIDLLENNA